MKSWAVTLVMIVSGFLLINVAVAQTSTSICWGQFKDHKECMDNLNNVNQCMGNACASHQYEQHWGCGSGGHSGFNDNYVCQSVCKKPEGAGCQLTQYGNNPGNQCGYSWVKVQCN
jgi:hypothetical protein